MGSPRRYGVVPVRFRPADGHMVMTELAGPATEELVEVPVGEVEFLRELRDLDLFRYSSRSFSVMASMPTKTRSRPISFHAASTWRLRNSESIQLSAPAWVAAAAPSLMHSGAAKAAWFKEKGFIGAPS